ncbi:hypothetical protein M9Y10_039497 [Tritrichomonas musculus]|uniref:Uncharacterized protein n=1 Tax=Tritrichomonas musculus TaxID=1915356 RepID=A0ABR2KBD9_9EUKA
MACLFEYLNCNGMYSNLFLLKGASLINFAPFITSLYKVLSRNKMFEISRLFGRDILAIFSTLFTFFRNILPSSINDENVYEYGLRIYNSIANADIPENELPIIPIDSKTYDFFLYFKLGKYNYFWKGDVDKFFAHYGFNPTESEIENAYKLYDNFTPKETNTFNDLHTCFIIKYRIDEKRIGR